MIKEALKSIFPIAFLKQCFLIYNKTKIRTIDKLLFREVRISGNDFLINRSDYPFRVNEIDISELKGRPEYDLMSSWFNWTQDEYILEYSNTCCIEPDYGWGMCGPNKLIYESIAFSRTLHQRKPNLLAFLMRKNIERVERAISLRDGGEENYFHFYNDVLGKLYYLRENGFEPENYSIIVSKKLWDKPYFRYYFENTPFLGSLNWVVQDKQYIECSSVVFCKPMTHSRSIWNELVMQPVPNATGKRKIFLTRSRNRLRFIENTERISQICIAKGLEMIDADTLSFEEQIKLFSETVLIVGIHGAGLTNMVYRNSNCRVLEIFPPPDAGYLPYHYILLAGMKRFQYRALIGDAGRIRFSGGFYLNEDLFESELNAIL